MTDTPDQSAPEPDETDLEEDLLYLTQNARVEITVGTQFTYRGNSHWPKVTIADGPLVVEGEDGKCSWRTASSCSTGCTRSPTAPWAP